MRLRFVDPSFSLAWQLQLCRCAGGRCPFRSGTLKYFDPYIASKSSCTVVVMAVIPFVPVSVRVLRPRLHKRSRIRLREFTLNC